MANRYKFDFTRMTAADIEAGQNCQTFEDYFALIRRFYVGDSDKLSPMEIMFVIPPLFLAEFREWTETITVAEMMKIYRRGAGTDDESTADDDVVRDLLNDVDIDGL